MGMDMNLSKEDREFLESILKKAEPYTDEKFEELLNIFDGEENERDSNRLWATWAKRVLEGKQPFG